MNLFSAAPDWAIWLLIALLAAAALQDTIQLRISNYITIAVFVLGIVAMGVTGFRTELWQNAALFALVLTVGAILFSRNILGGGDVKLFAAVALWTNFGASLGLIALIFVCGGQRYGTTKRREMIPTVSCRFVLFRVSSWLQR